MKPDNFLKHRWIISVILGLIVYATNALADETHLKDEERERSPSRHVLLEGSENQQEKPFPNYFSGNSFSEEYEIESEDNELLFAANKHYSSAPTEKTGRTSLRGNVKLNNNYLKNIITDTGYMLTSPWRWDKSDWITASMVAGTTGLFFILDDELREDFKEGRSSTTDDISSVFEPFGNSAVTFPIMVGFYLYGNIWENEKIERTALLATESFLVTSLFTGAIKLMMGRTRPFDGVSADEFDGPSTGNNAFPSGHTSTAFAIATVVTNEYEHVPLAAPISYSLATLTGLSRLNDQKHWASDVFFGAVLGYFTSKTILKLHSNKKGRHFTIYPQTDYRGGGLVLSTRF